MKKKTAILLVGALALTAVLSGCGKNKEATEAANESVESEDPEGKAKNSDDAEEEEKEEAKETAAADKKVGVFLPSLRMIPVGLLDGESLQTALEETDMMRRYFLQMKTVIRRYHRSSPFWTMKNVCPCHRTFRCLQPERCA